MAKLATRTVTEASTIRILWCVRMSVYLAESAVCSSYLVSDDVRGRMLRSSQWGRSSTTTKELAIAVTSAPRQEPCAPRARQIHEPIGAIMNTSSQTDGTCSNTQGLIDMFGGIITARAYSTTRSEPQMTTR